MKPPATFIEQAALAVALIAATVVLWFTVGMLVGIMVDGFRLVQP